jgi:hypothetical protein
MRYLLATLFATGAFLGAPPSLAQIRPVPLGHNVRLIMHDGSRLSGELLAAQRDSSWVLQEGVIHSFPLDNVVRVQVRGQGIDSRGMLLWTLIGGAVTGAALTHACESVSEGCGNVFVVTIGLWGVVGGVAALITRSPHRWLDPRTEVLGPYARYPQGLPPQFMP